MTIPFRERGYSVEPETGVVHERYQDHAPRALRTRSVAGVYAIANGLDPVPCTVCFPAPPEPRRPYRRAEPPPTDPEPIAES